jgi:signal transduction histidine kinase/ligand-binding sensor domain-containing protein
MRCRPAILLCAALFLGGPKARSAAGAGQALAAPLWLTRTWQTDEGLPDNNITGVTQTADGHLWVATLGGLMRFDGARFEEFSTVQLPKVPSRNVRKMYLDRRGRLWLAMDRGAVIRVDAAAARVFDAENGVPGSRVTAMAEDDAADMWFAAGSEVFRIRGDRVERFGAQEGLPAGGNSWLATDGRGQLWFARGSQVGVFRAGRWETLLTLEANPVRFVAARAGGLWICTAAQVLRFTEGTEPQVLAPLPARVTVRVLLEDRSGALWIGTGAEGLLRWRGNQFERVAVSHPEISALLADREGNLWVGTAGGGLNLLRPRAMDLIGTPAGLPFESVRSVCEDAQGCIWVALQDGSLARGRASQWQAVTSAEGWPGGDARCVAPARGGGVWIGTHGRGLQRLQAGTTQEWGPPEGLGSPNVRSLLQAANGDLWVATDSPNRLRLFKDGQLHDLEMPAGVRSIRALAEGVAGTIWAGTSDGQILRVAGDTVVNEGGAQAQADPSLSVRCLHATADGSLWIGYAGWGVGRWHDGHYARVGAAQGLFDDYVSQMLSDGQGRLWLTGNRGLFQVGLKEMVAVAEGRSEHVRAIAYGRSEGLPSLQPYCENSPAAWRGADGRLWFATRNGLLTVQPDKLRNNPVPPPVWLQEVKVDDRPVALLDSQSPLRLAGQAKLMDLRTPRAPLSLLPGHGKLEFVFTALSFNSPENVHFRHRLQGFDTEWIEAGTQRSAKYPRLPAGAYEFEVTACNEAGVWSQTGCRLAVTVQPFFWQTWWFRLGVVVAFTASVIGLVRYFSFRRLRQELQRLERQAALQKERGRIARDMHDEVGAKLSRLSLLSALASQQPDMPPSARGEVAEISETARETIRSFEEIVWAVNPKNDSLPNLIHYLCRFAEDFFEGSTVQCAFELPGHIPDVELPTELRHHVFLAAKEALNNVLKHAHARQVRLRLNLAGAGFEIEIADDGRGFASGQSVGRAGTGNGLGNMRERMENVGGRCELHSPPGQGVRVTLQVPGPP